MAPRIGERLHHLRLGDLKRGCATLGEVAWLSKRFGVPTLHTFQIVLAYLCPNKKNGFDDLKTAGLKH